MDYITINNKNVPITGEEKNLLEVIKKVGIEIPTFCYHSELSVYGACRMCLVEDDKGNLMTACSTKPRPGMKINTHSAKVIKIRKTIIELLLANYHQDCTTCGKSGHCKLQSLANSLGVDKIRFKPRKEYEELDRSSLAIVRNPNKCILCGDCVRMCSEVQGIGALGFVHRGPKVSVAPALEKNIADVECVNCGQCVAVCPTGAIIVNDNTQDVWEALNNPEKVVIAQIAPAVRVSIGEEFGVPEGENSLYKSVAALKLMGFDKVFDTAFTADLTVVEETYEFLERLEKGERLPQFTSCCPGWVTYAEKNCPDLLPNLSSCKSPQQMFGSLAKKYYAKELGITPDKLVVVSIMPCTAKKFEAKREEFKTNGEYDVDFVLTTVELARMIKEMGINFNELEPESLDMPFGFFTGAGVIFASSGGVAEAALRLAAEKITGTTFDAIDFYDVRGLKGIKEAAITIGETTVKVAVVSGLGNAQKIIEKVRKNEVQYDLIEVMACPGGCVGGGGQPVPNDMETRKKRAEAIYKIDATMPLKKSQDNPAIVEIYRKWLDQPNSEKAHHALHTNYIHRKRISGMEISDETTENIKKLEVSICVGTNCYLKGSYDLMQKLIALAEEKNMTELLEFKGTFCMENCAHGPSVKIGIDNHKYGVQKDEAEVFFNDVIIPKIKSLNKTTSV